MSNSHSHPHPHHIFMAEYAKDAAENDEPWKNWEVKIKDSEVRNGWAQCIHNPLWHTSCDYRRKPKTILINGYHVPEPIRTPPERGTIFFYPNLSEMDNYSVGRLMWNENRFDYCCLHTGIIHLRKEAAILHARALLSFTKLSED